MSKYKNGTELIFTHKKSFLVTENLFSNKHIFEVISPEKWKWKRPENVKFSVFGIF